MAARLQQALQDATAARRELVHLRRTTDDDDVLDALAGVARHGHQAAIELLVEEVDRSGVAARFVAMLVLDAEDVDEVTQDVLVAIASSVRGFRGESRFTTWLHPIARRRAIDHLRRRRESLSLRDDDLGDARRMSSMIASRESIRALLARLPDAYRAPVSLHDVEGLTYVEIADRLDRNVNTLKSQVARGRALVAAMVADVDGPSDSSRPA